MSERTSSASPRRTDTRDPRRARARALKILFQADVRDQDPAELLARVVADPRAWSMLDDLDPEEAGDGDVEVAAVDASAADAGPEPHAAARRRSPAPPVDAFTRSLVDGVATHVGELDALIQRFARHWTVARMPAVDRSALRLGVYELQHETTAPAVVINEIIELAKALSTDDSGRYVNGVLEAVRKHLAADAPPADTVTPVVPDVADPADVIGDEAVAEPEPIGEPIDLDVPEPVDDLIEDVPDDAGPVGPAPEEEPDANDPGEHGADGAASDDREEGGSNEGGSDAGGSGQSRSDEGRPAVEAAPELGQQQLF